MKDSKFLQVLKVFGSIFGFNLITDTAVNMVSEKSRSKLMAVKSILLILAITALVKKKKWGFDKMSVPTMLWGLFASNMLNSLILGRNENVLNYDASLIPANFPINVKIGNEIPATERKGLGSSLDNELAAYYRAKQQAGLGNIINKQSSGVRDLSVRYAA